MSLTSSRSWYSKMIGRVGVIAGAASLALAGTIPLAGSSSAETLKIATDNLPPSRGDPAYLIELSGSLRLADLV